MKNTLRLLGIIAFIAIIVSAFLGCKEEEPNPFIGTWEGGRYNYRYVFTDSKVTASALYDNRVFANSSYSYTSENLYYETLTGHRVNYTYRFEGNNTLILYDESSHIYTRVD